MKNNKNFSLFLLIIIAIISFTPILDSGIVTADDAEYYLAGISNNINQARLGYAKEAGRFYFVITQPIYKIPYLLDNLFLIKSINILLLLASIFVFFKLIEKLTKDIWLGILATTLFISFFCIRSAYNPAISYPWYFTGSFTILLMSILFAIKSKNSTSRKYFVASYIFYFFALIFYEVYILFVPIIFFASIDNKYSIKTDFKYYLKQSLPYLIISILYIICYVGFRIIFPPNYTGTSFANEFNLANSINTISKMALGSYPGFFYTAKQLFVPTTELVDGHRQDIIYLFSNAKLLWYVKAILTTSIIAVGANNLKTVKVKNNIILLIISLFYVYIPHIPLAFTEKYSAEYASNVYYITTFFSYFSVILFISILFAFISRISKNWIKNTSIILICTLVFSLSIITDFVNHHAILDMKQSNNRHKIIDKFIETETFKKLPEDCVIFSPNLYTKGYVCNMFLQDFKWGSYVKYRTNKKINFTKELNSNQADYFLNYQYSITKNEQFIVVGEIDKYEEQSFYTKNATCFYNSNNKKFEINIGLSPNNFGQNTIYVNSQKVKVNGNYISLILEYNNKKENFKPIFIQSDNQIIDINNISINPLITNKETDIKL